MDKMSNLYKHQLMTKKTNTNTYIQDYKNLFDEIWNDLESIKKRANKKTKDEFEILKNELKTAGNLKLKGWSDILATSNEHLAIDSLLKAKISNYNDVDILNVMKIDHKFAQYAFTKYCKKMQTQRNEIGVEDEVNMNETFVCDKFLSDNSTEIISWILAWNDFNKPMEIKPSTKITKDLSNPQILLFVNAFPEKTIITDSFQSLPLYIVQCCIQNKKMNKNDSATNKTKWFQLINDIFDIESSNINKNMPSIFQYLFNNFRSKWTNKLQQFLQSIDKHRMEINNMEESKNEVTDEKIEIINCDAETIINALMENKEKVSEFQNIRISFNKIINHAIQQQLSYFTNIKELDLSFNRMRYIPNIFKNMQQLSTLNLGGNSIIFLNELVYLKHCLNLQNLNLCDNPISFGKGFVDLCINIIPSMQILNNKSISEFNGYESPTTDEQFIDLFCKKSYQKPISSIFETKENHNICRFETVISSANLNQYKDKVKYLCLSSCNLLSIPAIFNTLPNIETLDLSNNYILEIKNLANDQSKLKELILNDNNLTILNGISCLDGDVLTKLEIGNNDIVELSPISKHCINLKYINFECNKIQSISCLSSLNNLIQINGSYNRINKSNDIYSLSDLENIAILDLKGNDICNTINNYRYYTIFCMKSLRMLDGKSVTNKEIEESLSMYGGRLHFDYLVNKIGHQYFDEIRILNLSNCNIAILDELTPLNPTKFSNIKELNLSDNNLSDNISIVLTLKTLVYLNLNNNQIDKIDGLNELQNLEKVQLDGNKIESISSLNLFGLQYLKYLSLNNNRIVNIDGLINLPNLQTLDLSSNKIRKIPSNSFNEIGKTLNELNLKNNGLRILNNLDALTNLKILNIANNRINNLRELKILEHLCYLFQIIISNNPIASNDQYLNTCYQAIIKCSDSIQFVDQIDLTELRTEIKLRLLNERIQRENETLHNNQGIGGRGGDTLEIDPYSDINITSSSFLSPLSNPIGLRIQKFKCKK